LDRRRATNEVPRLRAVIFHIIGITNFTLANQDGGYRSLIDGGPRRFYGPFVHKPGIASPVRHQGGIVVIGGEEGKTDKT